MLATRHRIELFIFLMVSLSGAYFHNGAAWNQVSRYDVIFSFVEPGTADHLSFRINRFVPNISVPENTGDWARNVDHDPVGVYSNKAPGQMLLGVVSYFPIYYLERAVGLTPETERMTLFNCYLLNLLLNVLPLAFAAVFFYHICLRLNTGSQALAAILTCALFLGSLSFPYSTQLWGHTSAMAHVVIALWLYLRQRRQYYVLAGLLAGLGTLTEYSVALIVMSFAIALIMRRRVQAVLLFTAGGIAPLILFLVYHKICFGSFLTTAVAHSNPIFLEADAAGGTFQLMQAPLAAWGVTFSPYRGLFWHMPVMLIAVIVGIITIKHTRRSGISLLCLANVGMFLAMNVTFNGWHGGSCIGPRYQIPVLPFYVLLGNGLVYVSETKVSRFIRWAGGLALVLSIANMTMASTISPLAREYKPGMVKMWKNPLSIYYPLFFKYGCVHDQGKFRIRMSPEQQESAPRKRAFNLGTLAGLSNRLSLLPWTIAVLGLMFGIGRTLIRETNGGSSQRPCGMPTTGGPVPSHTNSSEEPAQPGERADYKND